MDRVYCQFGKANAMLRGRNKIYVRCLLPCGRARRVCSRLRSSEQVITRVTWTGCISVGMREQGGEIRCEWAVDA